MIQQIPQQQLMDFWPYFKNHKFRNPLAQNLTWAKVRGFADNLENPELIMLLCQQWACYLAGNSKAENLKEFLVKIPEKAFIYVPSQEWESSLNLNGLTLDIFHALNSLLKTYHYKVFVDY